jgi:hypothetical protein
MAAEKQDNKELLIKDAQYRKGLSIAFFNATNAAIEMMKATSNVTLDNFHYWRDLLLDEHNEYYARVIAQVGVHYDPKVTIARLKAAKTKPELTIVWMSLSEDERQNEEIKKVAYALRADYLKAAETLVVEPIKTATFVNDKPKKKKNEKA